MKEDLSNEITDLTRKQLYQSSWNLGGTLKHKVLFFYFNYVTHGDACGKFLGFSWVS